MISMTKSAKTLRYIALTGSVLFGSVSLAQIVQSEAVVADDGEKKIPSKRATRPQATELTLNLIGLRPTGIFYFSSTFTRGQAHRDFFR